jgi:hypothetical protein
MGDDGDGDNALVLCSEDDEDESQYYPRRGRDTKKVSAFRKFFKS